MFYDTIKAAYPKIKIIATTPVTSRPMDVIDQHYYSSAQFFEQAATMFDGYYRSGPMVFVGEYAATAGAGGLPAGLLGNSIGEAAFMTGLERNSDIVRLSSYAPLFANYAHTQWNPDMIGYDQLRSFGATSYWVSSTRAPRTCPARSSSAGAARRWRASRCSAALIRRPTTPWRTRAPWCRAAARCTVLAASSATRCRPTR
jgi:hypothetical protein